MGPSPKHRVRAVRFAAHLHFDVAVGPGHGAGEHHQFHQPEVFRHRLINDLGFHEADQVFVEHGLFAVRQVS